MISSPACRRLLFPSLHPLLRVQQRILGDVCSQVSDKLAVDSAVDSLVLLVCWPSLILNSPKERERVSGKFTLQIVSNQRFVNNKFVSVLNIQLSPPPSLQYATCTSPIMHLICPPAPPKKIKNLHNLCFSFLLGITAVLREIENAYAKFWGANRVHYGGYASGVYEPTSSALDECLLVYNFQNSCSRERH